MRDVTVVVAHNAKGLVGTQLEGQLRPLLRDGYDIVAQSQSEEGVIDADEPSHVTVVVTLVKED